MSNENKHVNDDKKYLFDNPRNIRIVMWGLYGCCGLLFLLDFVIHRHTYHPWEWIWGFYPVYGFVGCVILVIVAKWMRTFLMRSETYYDEESCNEKSSGESELTVKNAEESDHA